MRGKQLPPSVAVAAVTACTNESERLNSECLAQRFGSYGIEVLSREAGLRHANLYSEECGRRTCRTYAIAYFADRPDSQIDAEHAQVLAGDSIGAIFKAGGWSILKQTLYIGSVRPCADRNRIAMLMRLGQEVDIALHVYRLLVQKDRQVIDYATLIELHHPEYMDAAELGRLYTAARDAALHTRHVAELNMLGLAAA